jgi:hypothetical protein
VDNSPRVAVQAAIDAIQNVFIGPNVGRAIWPEAKQPVEPLPPSTGWLLRGSFAPVEAESGHFAGGPGSARRPSQIPHTKTVRRTALAPLLTACWGKRPAEEVWLLFSRARSGLMCFVQSATWALEGLVSKRRDRPISGRQVEAPDQGEEPQASGDESDARHSTK